MGAAFKSYSRDLFWRFGIWTWDYALSGLGEHPYPLNPSNPNPWTASCILWGDNPTPTPKLREISWGLDSKEFLVVELNKIADEY